MALFLQGKQGEVRDLVFHLGAGTMDVQGFADHMRSILVRGHAYAAYLGRRRAGDLAPYDSDDTEFGRMIADEQKPFLAGFLTDLEGEKYLDEEGRLAVEPILRRASMYVDRMTGSANEAFVLATPDSADQFWWRLGPVRTEHCTQCPLIAAGSPYTSRNIPAHPGDGSTECGTSCACELTREDGVTGFSRGN